ncbi:hypothetical protein [Maribacter sp. Asnod1-A12]|uniref:hypothetical protein n=1 Tax=Maribacter sp. Asnod1-A12 TaxID=3160576 RepID=UPI00386E6FFD
MKKAILIILCLQCISCDFVGNWLEENHKQREEKSKIDLEKRTIDYYTSNLKIIPNKQHPKFEVLIKEFNDQNHRLAFNICEYKYNDQNFFFGDSPRKIASIFGEPDEKSEVRVRYESEDGFSEYLTEEDKLSKHDFSDRNTGERFFNYTYTKLNIKLHFKSLSNKDFRLESFTIQLSDRNDETYKYEPLNTSFNVILFREIPYKTNMTLDEFRKLTNVKDNRQFRSILQKECPVKEDYRIHSSIYSEYHYETKGGGHLTFSGDYKPNESDPIKSISFSERNLEYYKKNEPYY